MQYSITSNHASGISVSTSHIHKNERSFNLLTKFFEWCATQEHNRFLWMAVSYFALIGLALPATAYAIIFFGGNNFVFWITALAMNVPVLVLNLAALPTKITLSALIFAWAADAILILYCITLFVL
jgi:hypothetical protein